MDTKIIDYQMPEPRILSLADVELAPVFKMDSKAKFNILLHRKLYKDIEELAAEELKLAGLRINPSVNISSRESYYHNLSILDIESGMEYDIQGLPANNKYCRVTWNYRQDKITALNITEIGVEVWIIDVTEKRAFLLTKPIVNGNIGTSTMWLKNDDLLISVMPSNLPSLKREKSELVRGPFTSENDGFASENRTFQDLLKNEVDVHNFKVITSSEIWKYKLDGSCALWKSTGNHDGMALSPDGNFILLSEIKEPFSYFVTFDRFAYSSYIYDIEGNLFKTIVENPVIEKIPQGFMSVQRGMRAIKWRADKASTLVWAVALDEGDSKMDVPYRDEIFEQDFPFEAPPRSIIKTVDRFAGIYFGNDELALIYERWWSNRKQRMILFNPKNSEDQILFNERNFQDIYCDPGSFVMRMNDFGYNVLHMDEDGTMYVVGDGYSIGGKHPFVDKYNYKTGKKERIYQSQLTDLVEDITSTPDIAKGKIITVIQSKSEYPNFYLRNIFSGELKKLRNFDNPFVAIQNAHKEIISYQREDGVELTATLYLPPGYDRNNKQKLPMIMWAYPAEFVDQHTASQSTANSNDFIYPYWGSPLYWLNKNYIILDNVAFPIIGENNEQPNDTYVTQLVANAKAAIAAVDALGYIDTNKVAVGGHSYGAFMVAMLLTHSNLFAAGIARSGAYNRTLTPFGFQSEERNYWQAKQTYNAMNPFMDADQMKTPLLLIHGEMDNNAGTHTMQTERYFAALKACGANVRMVILPYESHGYIARESILHVLWEQDQWLEKFLRTDPS